MPAVPITVHLPAALWQAIHALAPHKGDAPTVILRAVEEYHSAMAMRLDASMIGNARSREIQRFAPTNHEWLSVRACDTKEIGVVFAPSTFAQAMATADANLATIAEREPRDQLAGAGWAVVAVLGALRERFENTPEERAAFDQLCGETQAWLRREIEALGFTKTH